MAPDVWFLPQRKPILRTPLSIISRRGSPGGSAGGRLARKERSHLEGALGINPIPDFG